MSRRAIAACGLLLLAAAPAEVVSVAMPREVRVPAGGRAEAVVRVKIRDGFKVQANPAADEYLVPLRLEVPGSGRLRLARVDYPEPERHRLRGAESDLLVYEGEVELVLVLAAEPDAPPGEIALDGRLHYQACNDRLCLRPDSVPLRLAAAVVPAP